MKGNEHMSTPRRRRKDHDTLNPVVGTLATVPIATGEIPNLVETVEATPTHDEIARRAYQLYEARGSAHGRDLEDWLEAEYELRQRLRLDVLASEEPYAAA
jgi:hypothetical protein